MMPRILATAVLATLLTAAPAAAQMWDAPTFLGPRPADDLGVYAFRPEGRDWGFAGIWRHSGNVNLGVRAGLIGEAGARSILVGAELAQPLQLFAPGTPLEISGTLGFGATFNGVTSLRIPLGLTAGFALPLGDALLLTPFVHPRIAFDLFVWEDSAGQEQTETEFNVPVDVGAELQLGESIVLRIGATIDRPNVIGAGVALRTPRRVRVR
jgi:hypothetical protein